MSVNWTNIVTCLHKEFTTMDRKQAFEFHISELSNKGENGITRRGVVNRINDIYNYFESRVCDNCEFSFEDIDEDYGTVSKCNKLYGIIIKAEGITLPTDNFGCSLFEPKKDYND